MVRVRSHFLSAEQCLETKPSVYQSGVGRRCNKTASLLLCQTGKQNSEAEYSKFEASCLWLSVSHPVVTI